MTVGLREGYEEYTGGVHPDNLAAADSLRAPFGLPPLRDTLQWKLPTETFVELNRDGDILCFGGPTSTPLTEVLWEFEEIEPGNHLRLRRCSSPILNLRFWGVSDINETLRYDKIGWVMEHVGPVPGWRWPIVDDLRPQDQWYVPTDDVPITITDERGDKYTLRRPGNNYLVVTRLPNFLHSSFAQVEKLKDLALGVFPKIVVIEGTNGIGTRAAELLINQQGVSELEKAKERLDDSIAFQLLFRVSGLKPVTDLSSPDFDRFTRIELVKESKGNGVCRLDEEDERRGYRKITLEHYSRARARAFRILGIEE